MTTAQPIDTLDLTGVPCPLSWAKAKVRLEQLRTAEVLALVLDDERGARDIPRAAEAEGYDVVEVTRSGERWRIVIQK